MVPEASRLWDPFQFQIRHSVSDGYAANTRAEHGLQELMPNFVNNRVFCSAHRLATALGNALNLAANDISGVLNTGLACSQVGSARKLRHCLASIFEERLEVEFSTPPIGAMRHRKQVFDRFLPIDKATRPALRRQNQLRRLVLETFLNGDPQSLIN